MRFPIKGQIESLVVFLVFQNLEGKKNQQKMETMGFPFYSKPKPKKQHLKHLIFVLFNQVKCLNIQHTCWLVLSMERKRTVLLALRFVAVKS